MKSALTISALGICLSSAFAVQDDPFGGGPVVAPQRPAATVIPEEEKNLYLPDGRLKLEFLPKEVQLVVDTVRRSNPASPKQLAEALRTMMDLDQFDEAKFYLAQLAAAPMDDAAMYSLNQSIGSDFFLRLARSTDLAPQGNAFAIKVIGASRKTASSPVRVEELINKLGNENVAIRSDASRSLARLGEFGVARMIEVFADDSRSDQFDSIRASLQSIGSVGLAPLIAASRSTNEKVQLEAVLALSAIRDPEAFDAIVARFYSSSSSERIKKAASTAFIDQYGYFPNAERVSNSWWVKTKDLLSDDEAKGARRLGFADKPANVWRWNAAQNRLGKFPLTRVAARRIRAADKAEVLAEINPTNQELQLLGILTQLEAQKQLAGPSQSINATQLLKKSNASPMFINEVLEQALERELIPAAIGACEVLEQMADPSVLASGTHRPCSLVRAILSGDRHLQYAAVRAIAATDPQRQFAGSSYFVQCMVFMANYEERPGVLIGNSREDLARTLAGRMLQSGLAGSTAANGRDFYRQSTQDANLRYLLISDTFHRPDYAELVQQLRQDWRTKRLPIAILFRAENQRRVTRVAENDDLTIAMPFTLNSELVALQVQQLDRFSAVWPVSIDDRQLQSEFALNWLAKAAKGDERYAYLDLASYESQLSRLIFTPGAEQVATEVISALGTPQSQRVLVNYASELALPIANREAAAEAFKTSVNENGILLTSSEIMQQYDRYNASEKDTQESQKILGDILDAIESRTKTGSR